jgi:hypothetical protein
VPVRHRAARLRPHRHRPPRARLSRLHPAPRRRLRPELLDRRNPLLVRHSARRSRLPHHPRLASLEARRPRRLRRLPLRRSAAAFLVRYAPVTQQERWEENAGYSPSTLAAVISALVCAADIARAYGASELGSFLEEYADWIEAHLDEWTTTNRGILVPPIPYHYMRIRPPAEGEPFHNDNIPPGMIHIANREPGREVRLRGPRGRRWRLPRAGPLRHSPPDDPLIIDTLMVVDAVLRIETPYGPCWRRYNHDGYGQRKDGGPFIGYGQGRAWPILTGERAHYELAAGQRRHLLHLARWSASAPSAA